MSDERIIEVDLDWLIKLKEYLRPEERWINTNGGRMGIILYTPGQILIFVSGKRMHQWSPAPKSPESAEAVYVCKLCRRLSNDRLLPKECIPL